MRVEDLRNYGRGLLDAVPDPELVKRQKQMSTVVDEELGRELGHSAARELMSRVDREARRMKSHDWSVLGARGLHDGRFIASVVRRIALMKCLADMVGTERATAIQCRLLEKTIYELMSPLWPSVEDQLACGDFFLAFRQYTRATMAANVRGGLHALDIVEDSETALAFNITYCVWHEVAKAFGDPYLCYPSTCYGDEVTIPKVLGRAGPQYRFERAGTLAQGAPVCDFRYEVVEVRPPHPSAGSAGVRTGETGNRTDRTHT